MRCLTRPARERDLFRDENGFTTTGMVLSLLVTISLLFTLAQVYRVESASADVQDVADAAALAAENQVAEFMLVARFCDAVVLSLSLTGIVTTGLGIAALCVPATASASGKLLEAGKAILSTRNRFSTRATRALNKLQGALPYFSAACAAAVSRANDATSAGSSYLGVGVLVPTRGEALETPSGEKADDLARQADEQADDIRKDAKEAEDAAKEANRSKEVAFEHDCGADGYCMYERARNLAGMSGASNPRYASVDAWSFSVAFNRARSYYRARLDREAPANDSVAERARSALRKKFYAFACDKLAQGYVHESQDSFSAYFPLLPKNTSEMRATSLYTDAAYPITDEGEEAGLVMHAFSGCPGATGAWAGYGSIAYMEEIGLTTCPQCGFTAASLGAVGAASSSIDNGFEYHYRIVAAQAEAYEEAKRDAADKNKDVKDHVKDLFDKLVEALKETADMRIDPSPPGGMGAIALVVNVGSVTADDGLASSFISVGGSLGPRAAISASTLLAEESDEGRTAINSLLDGLQEDGGAVVGAASIALDAWSRILKAYADGQRAITRAVENGLNALPLVGPSGLGTWAAEKLEDGVKGLGLAPAEVDALKPVLVNSGHVAAQGEGRFATGLVSLKQRVISHPQAATDLFSAFLTDAESAAIAEAQGIGTQIEIASIEIAESGGSGIPITIPIPDAARSQSVAAIQQIFARLRSWHAETMEVRAWQ